MNNAVGLGLRRRRTAAAPLENDNDSDDAEDFNDMDIEHELEHDDDDEVDDDEDDNNENEHLRNINAISNTTYFSTRWTVSRVYCIVSAILAAAAVLLAPQPSLTMMMGPGSVLNMNMNMNMNLATAVRVVPGAKSAISIISPNQHQLANGANVDPSQQHQPHHQHQRKFVGSSMSMDSSPPTQTTSTHTQTTAWLFEYGDTLLSTATATGSSASSSSGSKSSSAASGSSSSTTDTNTDHSSHANAAVQAFWDWWQSNDDDATSGTDNDDNNEAKKDIMSAEDLLRWWDPQMWKEQLAEANKAFKSKMDSSWWLSDNDNDYSESSSKSMSQSKSRQNSNTTDNTSSSWWWKWWRMHHVDSPEFQWLCSWLDPTILMSTASSSSGSSWTTSWISWITSAFRMTTVTDLLDKILTSTIRLLAIANWLLAVTYQLHTAVAVWFLGGNNNMGNGRGSNSRTGGRRRRPQHGDNVAAAAAVGGEHNQHRNHPNNNNNVDNNMATPPPPPNNNNARTERLGGFLLFKLLLISAVVAPDTLDLLILLSWYTLLSFLRSLALLCAGRTELTVQAGHAPVPGVLHLLVAVLVTDCIAAAVCVALFHGAGWGMVVLLTTDCVQLAVDCVVFILQHATVVLEAQHVVAVQVVEDERLTLLQHYQQQQQQRNASTTGAASVMHSDDERREERTSLREHPANDEELHRPDTLRLERRVEVLEKLHARRTAILDTTVFGLQLLTHALTVGHFLHIWSLHGVQFTLIDGVLALHLHSALSSACRKIAERRNLHRIARDLDGMFEDASELDLRKASATGDVCCICLGTMSSGNVKKVGCGHLYHTTCLREVVERARSIEAARCPLCRASVLDGRQQGIIGRNGNTNGNNENNINGAAAANAIAGNNANADNEQGRRNNIAPQVRDVPNNNQGGGEHALFRFSTENIFPAWLPLPAFSFEVVRRPPNLPDQVGVNPVMNNNNDTGNAVAVDNENDANNNLAQENIPAAARPQQQPSLIRRLLVLAGAIPMSPEEEAAALEQLVDMFPQYDRADLLRGLRERGSAEAVAEDVLSGGFTAIPRGAVNWPGPPMDR